MTERANSHGDYMRDRIRLNPMDVRLGRGKSFRKNPGNLFLQGNPQFTSSAARVAFKSSLSSPSLANICLFSVDNFARYVVVTTEP